MTVEVKLTSVLQRHVGQKTVSADGSNVGEVLSDLDRRYPGLKHQIVMEDGSLHRFVNLYLNDEDIRYLKALDTPVSDGDVLSILPALAGGAGRSARGHS